jgi:hypothetical protein
MTLAELLGELAAETADVAVTPGPGGSTEYRLGNHLVAVAHADGAAEFALDPAVAAAARRTPDTGPSDRGPAWVRFAPLSLDPHGADRATAWYGFAVRHAG